ncbi:polysaccharide lyase [Haloferula helveola]|uniref:Polysaccharide lyase n=1 Tax=Haloferula helveola TaxID=490095 RepID=A0ABN6H320_9BACT|nr:polysaccharide lyase [Haloferula helveola]
MLFRRLLSVSFCAALISCGEESPQPEPHEATTEAPSRPGILINGGWAEGEIEVQPGSYLRIEATTASSGRDLSLRDPDTGVLWYSGPAEQLDLGSFALRKRFTRLAATLSESSAGDPAVEQEFTIRFPDGSDALYPGLIYEFERRDGEAFDLKEPVKFGGKASWPDGYTANGYPAFRTGESVHTPPLDDVTRPWWEKPSYLCGLLPSLSIAKDRAAIIESRGIHNYPFNDLSPGFRVYARIAGELLIEEPGTHEFRLDCNLPGRWAVGASASEVAMPLKLEAGKAGTIPIEVLLANTEEQPHLASRLMWKPPGSETFVPFPESRLAHRVDSVREAALASVTDGLAHRAAKIHPSANDTEAAAIIDAVLAEGADLNPYVGDAPTFIKHSNLLVAAFLKGKSLAGDPRAARAAFALIGARSEFLRSHPDQLKVAGFGKTDGRMMRHFESLRGFLSLCDTVPDLQLEALQARSELAQYAVATCLSRSFFSEAHHGANDGYGDNDNLIVNFWRAARSLDDPHAWDTAACLMDSHFRYAAGRAEGLSSDGMFIFHNANGRHIHMHGYGRDWYSRIANGARFGSPWGYTREQYRRLTRYLLAFEWFFYQGTDPWVTNGRHNDHKGNVWELTQLANRLTNLPEGAIYDEDRSSLKAMHARIHAKAANTITGHRFFWRNLLTVHRRDDYQIDLKMISPMAGPIESFAGHFPWNMSFADGVTTFMRTGKEFTGIHRNAPNSAYGQIRKLADNPSLWRYRSLPGTTHLDDELHAPDRYRAGGGSTAGGVTDGELGHAAFHYVNKNTGGNCRKMHVFTDDGMLMLIHSITTSRGGEIPDGVTTRTNLNQCDWNGDVTVIAQDGTTTTHAGDGPEANVSLPLDQRYWVLHSGIGYLILPTGNEAGSGKAGSLNLQLTRRDPFTPIPGFAMNEETREAISNSPAKDRKAPVFHLSIDHGPHPKDASASYFVCMRGDAADAKTWLSSPPVEILANRAELQAARDPRDGTSHAFFREAGELKDPDGVLLFRTPTPLSVMWRPATSSVTLQDPIAACTADTDKMIDTAEVVLGSGLADIDAETRVAIPLRGTNDPDDRFRGMPATHKVE